MPIRIFKQLFLNFPENLQSKHTDFILTAANHHAYSYISKWPKWINNVVIISGPQGCGKSFLANFWQQKTNGCKINLFKINEQKLEYLLEKNSNFIFDNFDHYFTRKYLMKNLDKHDFSSFEHSFLKIFERIKNDNKYMLITSTKEPTELVFQTPDLASRIASVSQFKIAPPNEADIRAMIIKKFADLQLKTSNEVIDLISKFAKDSFIAAEDLINELNKLSLAEKKNINHNLVQKIIKAKATN